MEEASTSRSSAKRIASGREGPIHSLGSDILCSVFSLLDHFDLVRCSAVCQSWNKIIYTSSLMRDMYYKRNPHVRRTKSTIPSEESMRQYLEDLAFEEHQLALSSGRAEVFQWEAHGRMRANLCRMKRGLVLTGVGDRVLRLWSAQTCKYMDEFCVPAGSSLVDYDFDENKIVGLTESQVCIWRRHGQRGIFQSRQGLFTRGLCMSYADPEVVIGCEDGRARVFDMYSRNCSRIIRVQSGPLSCLTTWDQLIAGGSTFGSVAISDLTSGQRVALLKSSFSPTGMKCLTFNARSHLLFAGSTSGYAHCWDLRTLKPLWEERISPNVIYSMHHMSNDTSILAVGGLDGILRILNQNTGEIVKSYLVHPRNTQHNSPEAQNQKIEKKRAFSASGDLRVDAIGRNLRATITCLSVGMKKIVTTHGENFVRVWRFS